MNIAACTHHTCSLSDLEVYNDMQRRDCIGWPEFSLLCRIEILKKKKKKRKKKGCCFLLATQWHDLYNARSSLKLKVISSLIGAVAILCSIYFNLEQTFDYL